MRTQIDLARREGVRLVIAPMVCGVATLVSLKREFGDMMFIAHPSLGGLRIAPQALFGKLFRLFGADAMIFPNYGGGFRTRARCATRLPGTTRRRGTTAPDLAYTCRGHERRTRGRNRPRIRTDSMLLIGGALLAEHEQLAARSTEFVNAVAAAAER